MANPNDKEEKFSDENEAVPGNDTNNAGSSDEKFEEGQNLDSDFEPSAENQIPEDEGSIDAGAPEVASSPKKNILVVAGIVVVGLIVLFNLIGGDDDKKDDNQNVAVNTGGGTVLPVGEPAQLELLPPTSPTVEVGLSKPPGALGGVETAGLPPIPGATSGGSVNVGVLPPVPPPSISSTSSVPSVPPVPSGVTTIEPGGQPPTVKPIKQTTQEDKEKLDKRLKSEMIIVGGKLDDLLSKSKEEEKEKDDKPAIAKARKVGDTTKMIAQGKVIDAILESAINTDLPGPIRAIVSRDIYSESARNILIPKGSRLVGGYNADVKRGQGRVYIKWDRLIRPDAVDIKIDSPATDLLGRVGLKGDVDGKYFEIISNSILFSSFSVLFAIAAETATGSQGVQQTTNVSGSTTTSGKPSDFAIQDAVTSFGSTIKGLGSDLIQTKPTITIDQGTPIKVFVNKDLIFEQDDKKPDFIGGL